MPSVKPETASYLIHRNPEPSAVLAWCDDSNFRHESMGVSLSKLLNDYVYGNKKHLSSVQNALKHPLSDGKSVADYVHIDPRGMISVDSLAGPRILKSLLNALCKNHGFYGSSFVECITQFVREEASEFLRVNPLTGKIELNRSYKADPLADTISPPSESTARFENAKSILNRSFRKLSRQASKKHKQDKRAALAREEAIRKNSIEKNLRTKLGGVTEKLTALEAELKESIDFFKHDQYRPFQKELSFLDCSIDDLSKHLSNGELEDFFNMPKHLKAQLHELYAGLEPTEFQDQTNAINRALKGVLEQGRLVDEKYQGLSVFYQKLNTLKQSADAYFDEAFALSQERGKRSFEFDPATEIEDKNDWFDRKQIAFNEHFSDANRMKFMAEHADEVLAKVKQCTQIAGYLAMKNLYVKEHKTLLKEDVNFSTVKSSIKDKLERFNSHLDYNPKGFKDKFNFLFFSKKAPKGSSFIQRLCHLFANTAEQKDRLKHEINTAIFHINQMSLGRFMGEYQVFCEATIKHDLEQIQKSIRIQWGPIETQALGSHELSEGLNLFIST